MTDYLTLSTFKDASIAAPEWMDEVNIRYPTFFPMQFTLVTGYLDGRLRKRYPAAFVAPVAVQLIDWAARILTERAMLRRGIDATDEQATRYKEDREKAEKEVEEASDSENGRWDIPLRADTRATGIDDGSPLARSNASPYVWMDEQAEAAFEEDVSGSGSTFG